LAEGVHSIEEEKQKSTKYLRRQLVNHLAGVEARKGRPKKTTQVHITYKGRCCFSFNSKNFV
jgi:hypothetical protein